jgi:hypothetical protein
VLASILGKADGDGIGCGFGLLELTRPGRLTGSSEDIWVRGGFGAFASTQFFCFALDG